MAKEKKENNKKGSVLGIIAVILLVIAIALILLGLFGGIGFGNGDGTGTGSGNGVESSVAENSGNQEDGAESSEAEETEPPTEEETETEPEVIYIDVTVSGSSYLMDDSETTIDDITKAAENAAVRITDDSAVADAMDALISALDGAGISHIS